MQGAILVSDLVERDHAAALAAAAPGAARVVLRPDGPAGDPAEVEVAYFSGDLYPERAREFALALARSRRLAWLHSMSAGMDHPWFLALRERGVRLTNSSGASAVPLAQSALLFVLALSRNLPAWLEAQRRREWQPHEIDDLQGQRLGVLGMGPIGQEVARLALALRMHVVGVRRRPRGDEPCETWPLARLDALLPDLDVLVLALPLTDETRGLLDARRLAFLPPRCRVVNVGRGELVDETALGAALREGRLAGAALDVFEHEPLPPGSTLWTLPNVIVTPHAAARTRSNWGRATEIFLDNLHRYRRGEPLRNEVT